jgi:hypothetical protein
MNRMILQIACIAAAGLMLAELGCKDTCSGVNCAPAPPLLQVAVVDTAHDTMRVAVTDSAGVVDSVDTVVVVEKRVTSALVTLLQVSGSDTVAFDTLEAAGDTYYRNDPSGLPANPFIVRAERDGRRSQQGGLTIQTVDGCCPYSVIGFYTLRLPTTQ